MFKSKEDLIKESEPKSQNNEDWDYFGMYQTAIEDAFNSIAERKEFYKKYKDYGICAFIEENPKLYEQVTSYFYKLIGLESLTPSLLTKYQDEFRDWLFDFCFDGVK